MRKYDERPVHKSPEEFTVNKDGLCRGDRSRLAVGFSALRAAALGNRVSLFTDKSSKDAAISASMTIGTFTRGSLDM